MRTSDVLLIRPNIAIGNIVPHLGLGYLASSLIKKGYSVCIKDCLKDACSIKEVVNIVEEKKPKVLGITVCTNEAGWAKACIEEIRKVTDTKIVIGGPHPTGLKKKIFSDIKGIDFAIYSEGEIAFALLVDAIAKNRLDSPTLANIPNLLWEAQADIIENPHQLSHSLDDIDFPAWQLIEPDTYPRKPHGGFSRAYPFVPIITSRGCPYPCRFCAASLMQGQRIRRRSVNNIIKEIELLVNDYKVKEIHIEDDNFTFHKDFVMEFCEAVIQSKLNLFFSLPNGIRLDKIDQEMLSIMKKANFYSLAIGIESGSQRVLDRMGKNLDLGLVKEKISMIKSYGFITKGFFILGYPDESKKDIELTIKFSKELPLDLAFFSLFLPLPGTPEYAYLLEKKELKPQQIRWTEFYTGSLKNIPYSPKGLKKEELERYVSRAIREFYLRPGIIFKVLWQLSSWAQVKFLVFRIRKLILKI